MKNEQIEKLLKDAIKNEKVVNGYLFSGNGKTQHANLAKQFAKKILCLEKDKEDNCFCKSCIRFEDDNHPDYYEIKNEKTESIKIDEIRKMQEKMIEKPITSFQKVYIIYYAENMTKEAQNCLLKTLEEPPKFVTIILVVDNENRILPTIKSRCTKIAFTEENQEDFTVEEKLRYEALEKIFAHVEDYSSLDLLGKIDILYQEKENIIENLEWINMILLKKAKENPDYLTYIGHVEETKQKLNVNSNFEMSIDSMILKIWEPDF